MREVGVLEAKTNLSALLESVERGGEDILITRHGKPVARLSAAPRPRRASAEELLARADALHTLMMADNPEIEKLTWEDIRDWRDG